ncbi:MAG: hypothetical protein E7438_04665 [Ruminococcaceae bacterium]|nr:hypothetical protein [Oscillospiraceae bacterium]
MAVFRMKIAGAVAAVASLFDSTPHYLGAYLTDEAPDFSVVVTEEDLRFEQAELDAEAAEEGFRRRAFTDPFLERAAIQRAFAEYLFRQDTLLVHGSAVAVDGKAYLFMAKSGTGKSTHTRFWREVFGDRAVMINDDKPFLALTDRGVVAYGSPWSGKHGLDTNISAPLAGICILERGSENKILPISAPEALEMLRKQSYCPMDAAARPRFEALTAQLAAVVPLWRMTCTKDPQAASLAHDTMG